MADKLSIRTAGKADIIIAPDIREVMNGFK